MDRGDKSVLLQKLIRNIQTSLEEIKKIASDQEIEEALDVDLSKFLTDKNEVAPKERGKIIEGVFDGQNMIGPDGKQYSVPPNYASKSKLVEGDILKLTIASDGSFVYKQIQPIERERLIGQLVKDKESNDFRVLVEKKNYKVLLASVTYFKGDISDRAVILVPKGVKSTWAAIENIIKEDVGNAIPKISSQDIWGSN